MNERIKWKWAFFLRGIVKAITEGRIRWIQLNQSFSCFFLKHFLRCTCRFLRNIKKMWHSYWSYWLLQHWRRAFLYMTFSVDVRCSKIFSLDGLIFLIIDMHKVSNNWGDSSLNDEELWNSWRRFVKFNFRNFIGSTNFERRSNFLKL